MVFVELLQILLVLLAHNVAIFYQAVDLVLGPDAVVGVDLQAHGLGGAQTDDELVIGDGDGHALGVGLEHLAPLHHGQIVLGVLQNISGDTVLFDADGVVVHHHPLFDAFNALVHGMLPFLGE